MRSNTFGYRIFLVEIAVARGSGTYRELMREYKKVSLLILDEWHASLYDPTMADAIWDRIIYYSHTVKIEGDSMRKRGAIAE
jgi:DNA replication protein DnaC